MWTSFTGHRPPKLGGYDTDTTNSLIEFAVETCSKYSVTGAIVGMALGWDMAVADACIHLQIPFIACVPFHGQESKWPLQSRNRFNLILAHAEKVIYISETYSNAAFQRRNEYMVDSSGRLIALWDGSQGGTGNCVSYASRVGTPIINVWEDFKRF